MADPVKGLSATLKVSSSTTDASYSTVNGGAAKINLSEISPAQQDNTQFGDTAKRTFPTGGRFKGSFSGAFTPTDAGQANVLSAFLSGAQRWVEYLYDGTNGWKCPCVLTPSLDAEAGEALQQLKFDFEAAGGVAPVAVP